MNEGERDGTGAGLPLRISMDDPEPMYRQIEDQLRDLIMNGQLPAGTRLPSVRALAQELACSVITTRRAYQDLENEGFIHTRQGIGTTVAELGEEEKERYRRETVSAIFREAIGVGRRAGFTAEELRETFERIVDEERGGGE